MTPTLLDHRALSECVDALRRGRGNSRSRRPAGRARRRRRAAAARALRLGMLDLHLEFAGDPVLFRQWGRCSAVPLHVWEVVLAPYL